MRNFVVRGNRAVNTGCGLCASSVPGMLAEGNTFWVPAQRSGTVVGEGMPEPGDEPTVGAVVRNNTICAAAAGSYLTTVGGVSVSGNVTRSGADATTGVCAR